MTLSGSGSTANVKNIDAQNAVVVCRHLLLFLIFSPTSLWCRFVSLKIVICTDRSVHSVYKLDFKGKPELLEGDHGHH